MSSSYLYSQFGISLYVEGSIFTSLTLYLGAAVPGGLVDPDLKPENSLPLKQLQYTQEYIQIFTIKRFIRKSLFSWSYYCLSPGNILPPPLRVGCIFFRVTPPPALWLGMIFDNVWWFLIIYGKKMKYGTHDKKSFNLISAQKFIFPLIFFSLILRINPKKTYECFSRNYTTCEGCISTRRWCSICTRRVY